MSFVNITTGTFTTPKGQRIFTREEFPLGTTTFVVPNGVTVMSAVCVGGGGASNATLYQYTTGDESRLAGGGAGGALVYGTFNVTPGETITIIIGAGGTTDSQAGGFSAVRKAVNGITITLMQANGGAGGQRWRYDIEDNRNRGGAPATGGGFSIAGSGLILNSGGGNGGNGGGARVANNTPFAGGGGGAGGYFGVGGSAAYNSSTFINSLSELIPATSSAGAGGGGAHGTITLATAGAGGGGVGVISSGANGAGGDENSRNGKAGSSGVDGSLVNGAGGQYGAGGGASTLDDGLGNAIVSPGGNGVVRLIWSEGRQYPNINSEDFTTLEF